MVYNPASFTGSAQIPLMESKYDQLAKALSQGWEAGQAPGRAMRQNLGEDLKNQILQEQLAQAKYLTPQKQMESEQAQMLYGVLKNAFNGNQGIPNQNAPSYAQSDMMQQSPMQQAEPNAQVQNIQNSLMNQPRDSNVVRQAMPGMEQIDELYYGNPMAKKYLEGQGFKEKRSTHQSPETGQIFETIEYPSGKIEQKAYRVGDRPEDITKRKEEAKSTVKFRDELAATSTDVQSNLSNIDYAIDLLENNPEARNVIGPVNQHITRLFGNEADRQLLGQLSTTSGNIALDAAKSIKGAFTGRDLGLINSMKFNPGDTYGQFIGKLKAMKVLNERIAKKVELVDDLMDKGVSKIQAEKIAREQVPFDGVKDDVNRAMAGKVIAEKTINGKQYVQYANGEVYLK